LEAERDLVRRVEAVAALRRRLPVGAEVPHDYAFDEGSADLADTSVERSVRLSELFEPGKDSLVLYSFMYGPDMAEPCPMCTSLLDGLNGTAPHATQRVSFAVVAKSPIPRIRDWARVRGWRNLRLLSSAQNTYNRDYHGENPDGNQMPNLNVFVRRDGRVRHFWGSEMLWVPPEPGRDTRHVDLLWPVWSIFDLTPEGRGDWYPELTYRRDKQEPVEGSVPRGRRRRGGA